MAMYTLEVATGYEKNNTFFDYRTADKYDDIKAAAGDLDITVKFGGIIAGRICDEYGTLFAAWDIDSGFWMKHL